eukprot:301394_1
MPSTWQYVVISIEVLSHNIVYTPFMIVMFSINWNPTHSFSNECCGEINIDCMDKLIKNNKHLLLQFNMNILRIGAIQHVADGWNVIYQSLLLNYKRQQTISCNLNINDINENIQGEFKKSKVFDNMWSIVMVIEEYNELGLKLQLNCLPTNIQRVIVQIKFYSNRNNKSKIIKETFTYNKTQSQSISNIISIDEIKNYDCDSVTFFADILILDEFDTMRNDVTTYKIARDWTEFVEPDYKYEENEYSIDDLSKLDNRTKTIVSGYIRKYISNINDSNNMLYVFLSYIHDYFMRTYGEFIFNTRMKRKNSIESFYIAKLLWSVKYTVNGMYCVLLRLISIPINWSQIHITLSFHQVYSRPRLGWLFCA